MDCQLMKLSANHAPPPKQLWKLTRILAKHIVRSDTHRLFTIGIGMKQKNLSNVRSNFRQITQLCINGMANIF
jgi:hypothetical protein